MTGRPEPTDPERDLVIAGIVPAVRVGDDGLIRVLLTRLTQSAEVAALYALRDALADDLRSGPPPGRARAPVTGDDTATVEQQ